MARWKLFSRSKSKDEEILESEEKIEEEIMKEEKKDDEEIEEDIKTEPKIEDEPLAEYHETLQTGVSSSKKAKTAAPSDQRIWRDVEGIEDKIDQLYITKKKKPITELDKKVDRIISNVEIEKQDKHRKSSNVIYVVSKPQPGEVRGDWACRDHSKIYSHHKTKEKAIKVARKLAKNRNATVMVQNTDGTFSDGFKPRE
jgi:hypothetical protein